MTKDKALKLALEALEKFRYHIANNYEINAAIVAAREALEQPEQEPVALQMDVIVVNLVREGINKHRARELAEHFIKHTTPPQRTWVGLTPDDFRQLEKETTVNGYNGDYCPTWDLIEAVEEKLKEKNT